MTSARKPTKTELEKRVWDPGARTPTLSSPTGTLAHEDTRRDGRAYRREAREVASQKPRAPVLSEDEHASSHGQGED